LYDCSAAAAAVAARRRNRSKNKHSLVDVVLNERSFFSSLIKGIITTILVQSILMSE
tara:strand:+ start:270 stop:440 length:171 start_codon:yes stop_codon:yes gene_type:complete